MFNGIKITLQTATDKREIYTLIVPSFARNVQTEKVSVVEIRMKFSAI